MDPNADSRTFSTHIHAGRPVSEQELSLSGAPCQTEGGGTILLQLLEFKTHLLEAVEELHIRRDAETHFEDQTSKLVLEKQELEWEKESLQHHIETMANQHTESLTDVKKQFQAKIRSIEEEKGKYQVSAELKDKEINNLKEELKSLQLLKYNLEKKTSELEHKLALQIRSKDSHLSQLGVIEKRFSALSRQCSMVKQAHEKLEQNVDEAMKRNKKLNSANEKQEATIVSLKKEVEEVSNKLIKAKMSPVRHDKSHSATGREQRIQQLQKKLNMETEMNRKLEEENVAVRTEKQEVMMSLQNTQKLLLSQTQTVSRVELELQTRREQYQALKQGHEVMREKSKAAEDKVAQLMESYTASKTSWDKERTMFLDRIKSEQQELQAMNKAYNELHQKHTELSSQAKVQPQIIYELEGRDSSESCGVSAQFFPTLMEEIGREEALRELISSSETPGSGSQRLLASSQTQKPDCLEDTVAVTELIATRAPGGQDSQNKHQQSQFKQPLNPSNVFTHASTNDNLHNPCSLCGTTSNDSSMQNKYIADSNTSESDPYLIHATSFAPDDGLLISKGSSVSDTSPASSPDHRSIYGSIKLVRKEMSDGGMGDKDQRQKEKEKEKGEKNNAEVEEGNAEEQWEGESAGERRGTLMAQTTDMADRREDSQRLTGDAEDTKQPETETKDRAEAERTDGSEESGKTGPHTPETQIPAQTTTDRTTEKRDTQQVIDFMDSEPSLAACEPSGCSQSLSLRVSETVADSSHVKKGHEIRISDEHQSVSHGSVIQEVQCLDCEGARTFAQDLHHRVSENNPSDKSVVTILTELSEPLNQSSMCSSQIIPALLPAQSDHIVSFQVCKASATQTQSILSSSNTQRKAASSRTKSDVIVPHQFVQRSTASEQSTSDPAGVLGPPSRTITMFLKSKLRKDLLNTSSVSGTAASSGRQQPGVWKAMGETCRETATADMVSNQETRASLSLSSFPLSTSSITVNRLSCQTTPGAPSSAAGLISESDWELCCSNEGEDQQSSFRAHISKIEQFLDKERLHLAKRRRTDN